MAFPRIGAGEPVFPEMQGYRMACCDCGLVHSVNFQVVQVVADKGDSVFGTIEPDNVDSLRIILTAYRDDMATKQLRKPDAPFLRLLRQYSTKVCTHSNTIKSRATKAGVRNGKIDARMASNLHTASLLLREASERIEALTAKPGAEG